jgi:hypothetical protein
VDSLVKQIQSTPTWGSRLNLTLSVIRRPVVEPAQVEPVVDALLMLRPWTEIDVHHDRYYHGFECRPGRDDFSRLVVLVNESFPSKMLALVTVTDIEVMTQFVVASLEQLSVAHAQDRTLRPVLLHAINVLQQLMVELRNRPFAFITLQRHCRKCGELQSFLSSSAVTQVSVRYTGSAQRQHIENVLAHATKHSAIGVRVEVEGATAVRLKKIYNDDRTYYQAQDAVALLAGLIE